MQIDYTEYNALVNEAKAKIAAAPKCSLEESNNAGDKAQAMLQQLIEGEEPNMEDFSKLSAIATLSQQTEVLDGLEKTLELDLMYVKTRYLITGKNEQLASPAGFSPKSHVFVQTRMAIHTNKLPANLINVCVYDMDKIN